MIFEKIKSGVGWGVISNITVVIAQLLLMAILARLLSPEIFGVSALASVSIKFLSYFSQLGIAPALIRKDIVDEKDTETAFAVCMLMSLIFFFLSLFSSVYIANFYHLPILGDVICVLSANFLIVGFGIVSTALLRRNSDFKSVAISEIIGYIFGYGLIGVGLALLDMGVWSIVFASLFQSICVNLYCYLKVKHRISFKIHKNNINYFFQFGSKYSLIGFIEFLTSNMDSIIIGKVFGPASAGIYNRALLLANLPVQQPINIFSRTFFPVVSSINSDSEKREIYVAFAFLLVTVFSFFISQFIIFSAEEIVILLLGSKWNESVLILQLLATSVAAVYTSHILSVSLDITGHLNRKLFNQLVTITILLISFIYLFEYKLVGFAISIIFAEYVKLILYLISGVAILNIVKTDLLYIFPGILISGLLFLILWFFKYSYIDGIYYKLLFDLLSLIVVGWVLLKYYIYIFDNLSFVKYLKLSMPVGLSKIIRILHLY